VLIGGLAIVLDIHAQQAPPQPHGRLFPPQDLGLLEAPDRDIWQHPEEVMDKLGIAEASVVADVGAGAGWFTIRLARRVGPNGVVYAEDVQQEMVTAISRRTAAMGLLNVKPRLGKSNDPDLPAGKIDAVLLVNSFHEITDKVALLKSIAKALRPGGRIGIIDFKLEGGGPGPAPDERVAPEKVIAQATESGLRLLSQETFLPYQYFLIFGRDSASK
jgi:ubiquinone/menaquinone biosynthesis C-methylase UbiE